MTLKTIELSADMNCRACQYRVEKSLKQLDGVISYKTDLRGQQVSVQFDPLRIEENGLRQAIDSALSHGLFLE